MEVTQREKSASYYLRHFLFSLLILCLTLWIAHSYPFYSILFPPVVADYTTLAKENDDKKLTYVNLYASNLYYTGCDNTQNGKILGHYYYALHNNCCMLFLLKSDGSSPERAIKAYQHHYKLVQDEDLINQLTTSLASEVNWKAEALKNITVPMLASEADYPHISTVILAIILSIVVFLLIVYLFICTYHFIYLIVKGKL